MSARLTSPWLNRASVIAMGAVLASIAVTSPATAQSFNASGSVVAGSANVVTTVGITNVTVNSPQAVIDWTPTDVAIGGGPIDFQSAGTTATFSTFSSPDFAVLNRILPADPTRPVQFNGTINGRIGISVPVTGGSVYFYSPGGIILGSNARIDVGALGLTTAPPAFDPSTGDFVTAGSVVYGTANPGTGVVINPGALITAPVDMSSYVAIFAPFIQQDGQIDVNGSTALVAAGAGTLTWNGGLFDVQVTVGTDGDGTGTAIRHSGSTGGATGSAGTSDFHRVYMVAVPKNNAITTMITSGSTLGFDIATAADNFGNVVILSAGFDQSGDAQVPSAGAGTGAADMIVTNASVTSNLIVNAKGTSLVRAASGGITALAADAYIQGGVEARLESSGSGSSLTVAGNLTLRAANNGDTFSPSVTGGTAYLASNNAASLTIGGSATLDASASSDAFSGAGNATGGTARVDVAAGGLLSIGSDLFMSADGFGSGNGPMGDGMGGLAEIVATGSGASISIGGTLTATGIGIGGGTDGGRSGFAGGNGIGGTARIIAQGGNNITVQGMVDVRADGLGGDGNLAQSGTGTGGLAIISAGTGSMLDLRSDVVIAALGRSGYGFNAQDGGNGTGGNAVLETTGAGAVVLVGGSLLIDSNGLSDGTSSQTGSGGNGTGGASTIRSVQGSIAVSSFTNLNSDGQGGISVDGTAGTGRGGRTSLFVDQGGSLAFAGFNGTAVMMQAKGAGGSALGGPGNGGVGVGGIAEFFAMNGGAINTTGDLEMFSAAFGGDGFNGGDADGRPGGPALTLSTTGGFLTIGGNLIAVSTTTPGVPTGTGNPGASFGGSARLFLQGGAVDVAGTAVIDAPGTLSVFADGANLNAVDLLLTTGDFVSDAAGTPATPGTLTAGSISILSGNNIILGASLNSTGSTLNLNANGLISTLDLTASTDIFGTANGLITIGKALAGENITLDSGDTITTGSMDAGDTVAVSATDSIIVKGAVTAGLVNPSTNPAALYNIGLAAGNLVSTGALCAANLVAVVSGASTVTTGVISAANDVLVLGRNGVSLGGISASGFVYIADSSMFALGRSQTGFDPAPIFSAAPTPMAGPIAIGNSVAGNVVIMSTLSNLDVQAVTASARANLFASGLLSLNGIVSAPDIAVTSSDIAIGVSGGLNAGTTGAIRIVGLNSAGMRIGNGGSVGYQLDNAEFSRISSGNLSLSSSDISGLPIDMTIGDLDITGPFAGGGTIGSPTGAVTFFTGNLSTKAASGTIRVVGSVRARGFGTDNALVFDNDTTEVDAQRGLLETVGTGTNLAGAISFMSRRIHVAQTSILDQLQQDPLYAGRVADINRPLATPRPDGVVRTENIGTDNAIAVLIQNTGTIFLPAGFLVFSDGPIHQSKGSYEFIINGQLLTPDGLLTGNAVHDFLIDDANRANFTAESTINGCLVSIVACGPPPSSQDFLQADSLGIFTSVPDVTQPDAAFAEPQSEEERKQQEEAAEATRKAPIPPPSPLINTRPLDPPIDVDEPVSGSGNPALIGGGVQP